jgi:hypothetical protein
MNYFKVLFIGIFVLSCTTSCQYCSTCKLYQNDQFIFSTLEFCANKKKQTGVYKENFEKQNALLKYANAKYICEDE